MEVKPEGPIPARVMVVGEAPGAEEERIGRPFVGVSGMELDRMLGESGMTRSECFMTNVARVRPPNNDIEHFIARNKKAITAGHSRIGSKWVTKEITNGIALLHQEINLVQPNIIIALGNVPMWALTGLWGITRWRGSMLHVDMPVGVKLAKVPKVLPTYHPAAVLRQWEWRAITIHDLKRAARFRDGRDYPDPKWEFHVWPTFEKVCSFLIELIERATNSGPIKISFDIETRSGHIDCAGISWNAREALCIPFLEGVKDYWSLDDEATIIWLLCRLLTHPRVQVIGQNLLYDSQYTYRRWHFIPHVWQDTMISHHVAFAGLPKKLDFQASMYCRHYVQWKPDRTKEKEGG